MSRRARASAQTSQTGPPLTITNRFLIADSEPIVPVFAIQLSGAANCRKNTVDTFSGFVKISANSSPRWGSSRRNAMATATATRTKLVIESAEAVLGLHWFVARDCTAKEEGLEFEIITPGIKAKFDCNEPHSRQHHLLSGTDDHKAVQEE